MKNHALFIIFEKTAKFEIVVCCKQVALYGLVLTVSFYKRSHKITSNEAIAADQDVHCSGCKQ